MPFGIKDDLYAEETAVFLSSASKGLSIPTYGSIKRWKDKGIFPAERTRRLQRFWFGLDAYESRWENGFAALARFKARKGHCRVSFETYRRKVQAWTMGGPAAQGERQNAF